MKTGEKEAVRGTEVITTTGQRFHNIVGLVQNLDTRIQEISAAAEELSASSSEVARSVAG